MYDRQMAEFFAQNKATLLWFLREAQTIAQGGFLLLSPAENEQRAHTTLARIVAELEAPTGRRLTEPGISVADQERRLAIFRAYMRTFLGVYLSDTPALSDLLLARLAALTVG